MATITKRMLIILIMQISSTIAFGQCEGFFKIEKEKVGQFEIGMNINEVYSIVGIENTKIVDLFLEAQFSPAIIIDFNNNPSLICELDCEYIWRIDVISDVFCTKEGIHVGSKMKELRSNYIINRILKGESGIFLYVETLNMSFRFDYLKIGEGDLKLEMLPDDIEVKEIVIL